VPQASGRIQKPQELPDSAQPVAIRSGCETTFQKYQVVVYVFDLHSAEILASRSEEAKPSLQISKVSTFSRSVPAELSAAVIEIFLEQWDNPLLRLASIAPGWDRDSKKT